MKWPVFRPHWWTLGWKIRTQVNNEAMPYMVKESTTRQVVNSFILPFWSTWHWRKRQTIEDVYYFVLLPIIGINTKLSDVRWKGFYHVVSNSSQRKQFEVLLEQYIDPRISHVKPRTFLAGKITSRTRTNSFSCNVRGSLDPRWSQITISPWYSSVISPTGLQSISMNLCVRTQPNLQNEGGIVK